MVEDEFVTTPELGRMRPNYDFDRMIAKQRNAGRLPGDGCKVRESITVTLQSKTKKEVGNEKERVK